MRSISILAIASTLCISSAALAAAPSTSPRAGGMSSSHATQPTQPSTMTQSPKSTTTTTTAPSSTTTTQRGPSTTGQPSQDCETLGNQPGGSMSAPGSAFNPNGTSGGVYAGEQPQNSRNTASVSQYDVACAKNKSSR